MELKEIESIELIDTLWNVNEGSSAALVGAEKRINRYIMECKFAKSDGLLSFATRINRYIMECKYIKGKKGIR